MHVKHNPTGKRIKIGLLGLGGVEKNHGFSVIYEKLGLSIRSDCDGTIRQEWPIGCLTTLGTSMVAKWLVVQQPATPDEEEERLFLVPVEP